MDKLHECAECGREWTDHHCPECGTSLPNETARCAESCSPSSDWVAEAEAALTNAIKARDGAREAKEWNALVALEKAVRALDAAPHLKRPPSATSVLNEPRA